MKHRRSTIAYLAAAALIVASAAFAMPALARDAAFIEPGSAISKSGSGNDALVADPKAFDAGESSIGTTRRVSLFFVNVGGTALQINDMTITGDGNVNVQHEDSDCKTDNKIAANSRCSVALSITPTGVGNWSVEILAKHDGAGRITRATVNGKAAADAKNAMRSEGLNLSSRDVKPIDFADVETGGSPAVRTALLVNDSPESLTIKAIDLIAVDQGLERLLTGCAVDQVLAPDASCPITLKWQPANAGNIATDLIVRHTGKMGFTVISIRGKATGGGILAGSLVGTGTINTAQNGKVATPPTAAEVEQVTGKLPSMVAVPPSNQNSASAEPPPRKANASNSGSKIYLIGMVGKRGIFQRDGVTKTIAVGNEVEIAGATLSLLAINDREARIMLNGQPRLVKLAASGYRPAAATKEKTDNSDNVTASLTSALGTNTLGTTATTPPATTIK